MQALSLIRISKNTKSTVPKLEGVLDGARVWMFDVVEHFYRMFDVVDWLNFDWWKRLRLTAGELQSPDNQKHNFDNYHSEKSSILLGEYCTGETTAQSSYSRRRTRITRSNSFAWCLFRITDVASFMFLNILCVYNISSAELFIFWIL